MGSVINLPYTPDWVDYLNAGSGTLRHLINERNAEIQKQAAQEAFLKILKQKGYDWRAYYNPQTGNVSYSVIPKKAVSPANTEIPVYNVEGGELKQLGVVPKGSKIINPKRAVSNQSETDKAKEWLSSNHLPLTLDNINKASSALSLGIEPKVEDFQQSSKRTPKINPQAIKYQQQGKALRDKAKELLTQKGMPLTEANIMALVKQLVELGYGK